VEQLRRGLCHTDYERDRRAGRIDSLVSSQAARRHIVLLCVNGWRYREIARAAGINRSLIAFIIARGRELINVKTDERIRGIDPADREAHIKYAWDTRRANDARNYEKLRARWTQENPVRKPVPPPEKWTEKALCAQVDNELFFPEKGAPARAAKKVCTKCEVRQPCLDFALENNISYGIFGGLSLKERRKLA
jgi:WhiB family redox-sensing transcriptional regulator